ncbi:hypothetical protein BDB00DRAFT_834445 [Zychaea mexicana]|uniref:uncharacterized protein n=1 Tax=Zychaea mexicana TaxID=64656 RepID=UPI0022FEF657|nr:uncharacterized protein BDB00DRAFT_834445 [Zychaea mexicana]KAI9491230.1 hypothetical protein BDB00DRAFT_834445 [Zychaea mexicana]
MVAVPASPSDLLKGKPIRMDYFVQPTDPLRRSGGWGGLHSSPPSPLQYHRLLLYVFRWGSS